MSRRLANAKHIGVWMLRSRKCGVQLRRRVMTDRYSPRRETARLARGVTGRMMGIEPKDERGRFYRCSHCSQLVDRRQLGEVLHHEVRGHLPPRELDHLPCGWTTSSALAKYISDDPDRIDMQRAIWAVIQAAESCAFRELSVSKSLWADAKK